MVIKLPTVFLQIQWSSEKTNSIQMWISVITDTIFSQHISLCVLANMNYRGRSYCLHCFMFASRSMLLVKK